MAVHGTHNAVQDDRNENLWLGNMGIAYAMLSAARGYRVKLTLPQNASPERIKILNAGT